MSTTDEAGRASLFVTDLSPLISESLLYEIFAAFVSVTSVHICRERPSRRSLGYGYVNLETIADAEKALEMLNYFTVHGSTVRVMMSERDPDVRKGEGRNIYVQNLDPRITSAELHMTFNLFGTVLASKVAADPDGNSRCCGFVQFKTKAEAETAIERADGMQILGKIIKVQMFRSRAEREGADENADGSVYVRHIPAKWDEGKLMEIFSTYGSIRSARILRRAGGRFAYVNFASADDAKKAVSEMHGKDVAVEEHEDGHQDVGRTTEREEHLLDVAIAQTRAEIRTQGLRKQAANIYIRNLPRRMSDLGLRDLFSPYGIILSSKAVTDWRGFCTGIGFVGFTTCEDATKAVREMHMAHIGGRPLNVCIAESKKQRQERTQQSTPGRQQMSQNGMSGVDFAGHPSSPRAHCPQDVGDISTGRGELMDGGGQHPANRGADGAMGIRDPMPVAPAPITGSGLQGQSNLHGSTGSQQLVLGSQAGGIPFDTFQPSYGAPVMVVPVMMAAGPHGPYFTPVIAGHASGANGMVAADSQLLSCFPVQAADGFQHASNMPASSMAASV